MMTAPARIGTARMASTAVMNSAHTDSGSRNQVIPGARRFTTVVM